MACECRTGARSLVVLARSLDEYPELASFPAGPDWSLHLALSAVRVEVGAGRTWSGVAEVAGFLRAVLGAPRFGLLRAAWVDSGVPLEQQVVRLIHAEPLADLAAADSSPLAGMLAEGRLETRFQPIFWSGTLDECLVRGRGEVGAGTLLEWARQENLTFMLDRLCREAHLRRAGRAGRRRTATSW